MSEIQSVNVFSVDEERLKYRVIISAGVLAALDHTGDFEAIIPPPTSFANSNNYNQCIIKIDSFTATPDDNFGDVTWVDSANKIKPVGVVIKSSIGSSQASSVKVTTFNDISVGGVSQVGGFRQFIPLQIVNVGTTGNGIAAQGPTPSPEGYAWVGLGSGISSTDPILSANPFGQKVKFTFIDPTTNNKIWIARGAGGLNIATYVLQLTITMIPNNRSEGSD